MSNHKYDYLFKLIIIGESSVGKVPFLSRFIGDSDTSDTTKNLTKIGLDFKVKIMNFENKLIKLQIWDTAGEERFRTITKTYYKGTNGIILMYDITDKNSFEHIRNWMEQILQFEEKENKSIIKVLVGNNCHDPARVVTEEDGQNLAKEYDMGFFEASPKTNQNVQEVFNYLVKEILFEKGVIKDEMMERKRKEREEKLAKKNPNCISF